MVYTCILIHSTRMKAKGKELVKIIDKYATVMHSRFFQLQSISISAGTTYSKCFEVKQKTIK